VSGKARRCRCGALIELVTNNGGPFTRSLPPTWWVHIDYERNLSHQAKPVFEP
jgi:hypothetical protein